MALQCLLGHRSLPFGHLAHSSTRLCFLQGTREEQICEVVSPPSLAEAEARFQISFEGVIDVKDCKCHVCCLPSRCLSPEMLKYIYDCAATTQCEQDQGKGERLSSTVRNGNMEWIWRPQMPHQQYASSTSQQAPLEEPVSNHASHQHELPMRMEPSSLLLVHSVAGSTALAVMWTGRLAATGDDLLHKSPQRTTMQGKGSVSSLLLIWTYREELVQLPNVRIGMSSLSVFLP